ncbi:MAG: PQQ-dependent sugar dehydrogenase [Planctomycetota bacterium]|nr:PQQ-dependent sugar dehydrogenase [Planctomycetota bacterium]
MNCRAIGWVPIVSAIVLWVGCSGGSSSSKKPSVPTIPTIQSITPSTGIGGESATIIGTNFDPAVTVSIGPNAALSVVLVSATEISLTIPTGSPGPADVVVTNPGGLSATLPGGFTYYPPPGGTFSAVLVLTGLNFPISMAFAPDWATTDRLFFTEKTTGSVRIIQAGALLPQPFVTVTVSGTTFNERGLLGITFDPDYSLNSYVYIFYDVPGFAITQKVERWEDVGNTGMNPFTLIDNLPSNASNHNGGNLAFGPDGMLYVTLGEDAVPSQSSSFTVYPGKMLRMDRDGNPLTDNPWYDPLTPGSPQNHFFAMGLRNSFDMAFHPLTGEMYASENGPGINDELNLIRSGDHYGWDGARQSGPRVLPGFVDPVDVWSATVAVTGVAFNVGYQYPESFVGDIFVGAWKNRVVYRTDLAPPSYTYDSINRTNLITVPGGGITDVVAGPDGFLYVSTSSAIYRIEYN